MNDIPENQMDIFEALSLNPVDSKPKFIPEQRYLEPRHFDDSQTNPNFVSYLLATGKRVGDPYRLSEAQTWIDQQVLLFKQSRGRSDHDRLNEIEEWPSKMRIYLREVSEK